jgi:hypothetical protein
MFKTIEHVRFWCFKVLPLVYDDSLSYYEVLCKVVAKLNEMITELNEFSDEYESMMKAIAQIQEWIDNFDTSYAEKIIKEHIATMIFVEITDSGYIVYNIPKEWSDITFNTTGLDIDVELQPEYGHLVLSY